MSKEGQSSVHKRKATEDSSSQVPKKRRTTITEEQARKMREEVEALEASIRGIDEQLNAKTGLKFSGNSSTSVTSVATTSSNGKGKSGGHTDGHDDTERSTRHPKKITRPDEEYDNSGDGQYDPPHRSSNSSRAPSRAKKGGAASTTSATTSATGGRAKRTPKPVTKLGQEAESPSSHAPHQTPMRRSTASKKTRARPILPTPAWERILPLGGLGSSISGSSGLGLSQRMLSKGKDPLAYCQTLLNEIMAHQHAYIFNSPVDAAKLGLRDYHELIKEPMDLGTIKRKFTKKSYNSIWDFHRDMRLVWDNAMLYNPKENDVHKIAVSLSIQYEAKFRIAKELDTGSLEEKKKQLKKTISNLEIEYEKTKKTLDGLRATSGFAENGGSNGGADDMSPPIRPKSEITVGIISHADKCQLCNAVNGLQDKYMQGLIRIFREENPSLLRSSSQTVEVQIDGLSSMLLRRLEVYLQDCKNKDLVERSQAEGRPLPPELMQAINQIANTPQEMKSSSSSGSSSSSDSSDSESDDDGRKAKPVLIVPSHTQLPTKEAEPETTQQTQQSYHLNNTNHDASNSTTQGNAVPNIDRWGLLNGTKQNNGLNIPKVEPILAPQHTPLHQTQPPPPQKIEEEEEGLPGKTVGGVWNDFKNRQTQSLQMEKELREQEAAKVILLKQKEEEDRRLAEQMEASRIAISVESGREELAILREAERLRREKESASLNLMSQTELMADHERNLRGGY